MNKGHDKLFLTKKRIRSVKIKGKEWNDKRIEIKTDWDQNSETKRGNRENRSVNEYRKRKINKVIKLVKLRFRKAANLSCLFICNFQYSSVNKS